MFVYIFDFGDQIKIDGAGVIDTFCATCTLRTAYLATDPHAGTYTRAANGSTWRKQ